MSNFSEREIGILTGVLRLSCFSHRRLRDLHAKLGSFERLLAMDHDELRAAGAPPRGTAVLLERRREISPDEEIGRIYKEGMLAVPWTDELFPPLLAEMPGFAPLLFVRGDVVALHHPFPLAVVGTRRHTDYGRRCAEAVAGPVAAAGACVVSGLALGIDSIAHRAALEAGGRTVAVLGSGCDRASVQPRRHAGLAEDIVASGGAVVSEFPPGFPASTETFPIRNLTIAGLALGTLVIEAAAGSGALITGRIALDGNRDVMAVPGPIDSPQSEGTNALLCAGAAPIRSAADVMEFYAFNNCGTPAFAMARAWHEARTGNRAPTDAPGPADPDQRAALAAVGTGAATVDDIAARAALPPHRALAALTGLELAGTVEKSGPRYLRKLTIR